LLSTEPTERTDEQNAKLRAMYLAQDKEHARLAAEAAKAPPSDARVDCRVSRRCASTRASVASVQRPARPSTIARLAAR
jgi:hypothetical protein